MSVPKIFGSVSQRAQDAATRVEDEASRTGTYVRTHVKDLAEAGHLAVAQAVHEAKMARIGVDGTLDVWKMAGVLVCLIAAVKLGRELGELLRP